jgi:hypothetical protein
LTCQSWPNARPLYATKRPRPSRARRLKEQKEAKRVAAKQLKEEEKERKRQEAQTRLAGMSEEQRVAHEERRKVGAWRGCLHRCACTAVPAPQACTAVPAPLRN